jgi:hypothetical protein
MLYLYLDEFRQPVMNEKSRNLELRSAVNSLPGTFEGYSHSVRCSSITKDTTGGNCVLVLFLSNLRGIHGCGGELLLVYLIPEER